MRLEMILWRVIQLGFVSEIALGAEGDASGRTL